MRARCLVLLLVGVLLGCDSDSDPCEGFETPQHPIATSCGTPDLNNPQALVECLKGAGHMGSWVVDGDGLPAFDFSVEQRCDEAAHSLRSSGDVQSDPVHLLGNGRGLVAMAHASGGVEIYTQDRGHKWINHIDTWRDPDNSEFPAQVGGGFNYLVVDGKVRSTRFEDNPVSKALGRQTRRFGVGYFETVTTYEDLRVTRRVFAPESNARALVAEVQLENLTGSYISVGVVEFWDLNQYQLSAAEESADAGNADVSEGIRRARRDINADFGQTLRYSREQRIASSTMTAAALPPGVTESNSPSKIDYFPADVFLATIDNGPVPDAVWLSDDELWKASKTTRPPPSNAAKEGDGESRELEISGDQQAGILAMRVQVSVPTGAPVVRRFAMGYTTPGISAELAITELRARNGELAEEASASWLDRLAWVAVDDDDAGVVQRELAWSSYYAQAHVIYDEMRASRAVGGGGAAQYIAGLDSAAGDLALQAEALIYLDPALARDNLLYALSSQHGAASSTPYRFSSATAGVDSSADGLDALERSDAYFLLPSAIGRYVAQTRDFDFLAAKAPYWPVSEGEIGSALDHLSRSLDYARSTLGMGARGLLGMGSRDFETGILAQSSAQATAQGSSSVFNTAVVTYGFPLLVELLLADQPDLGQGYEQLLGAQANVLDSEAFNGQYYERAFADEGEAIAPDSIFLSAQVLPILAGMVDETRRDALLDLVAGSLDSATGAVSQAGEGGADASAVIVPAINAWLTEAIGLRDSSAGWDSLVRSTLAARADLYPELGYAPWTGPDAYAGPDAEQPGQARISATLAETDYPAFGAQAHMGPLRALVGLLGVSADASGMRIEPRLPNETFSVRLPRLELTGTPTSITGAFVSSRSEVLEMVIKLPSGARAAGLAVTVRDLAVEFDRGDDDTVRFSLPVRRDEPARFSVRGL